ncbi:ATP-binding protein [Paenibacillus albidus]|uniref:ATP-binding protein n=1 Tax=Paenibacillus albidus TaxID=2041023 RepID=UPI001BE9B236|nr:ATP-binding protein [Paenibacillus albidus]
MSRLSRNVRLVFFLFVLLLLVLYLSNVVLNHPKMGISVETDNLGQVRVSGIDKESWAGYDLKPGDIITAINGAADFELVQKYNMVEQAETLDVLRKGEDGRYTTLHLTVKGGISNWNLILHLVFPGVSLLLFLVFCGYVYLRQREDRAAGMLILFFMSIGLSYFSSAASAVADPVGRITLGWSFALLPVFFIHFMINYLHRYKERFLSVVWLRVLYGLAGSVAVLVSLSAFTELPVRRLETKVLLAFFAFTYLLIVAKLIAKYYQHRHGELQVLFKFTLTAHILAFLPFLLFNGLPELLGLPFIPGELTAIFLFAVPVVYFYLFMTNRLFDIDFVLNRFLYYTAISFLPTALILGLMALILYQSEYTWIKWLQIFIVVYLIMTVFLFTKEFIDFRLRPNFLKETYNFQGSIERFSKEIPRVMNLADMEMVLEREIRAILPVRKLVFFELTAEQDSGKRTVTSAAELGPEMENIMQAIPLHPAVGELIALPRGACLAIGQYRMTSHLLWIDDKNNHTSLNLDERTWLKTIANYSGIVYENLHLIEVLIEDLELQIKTQQDVPSWVLRLIFTLSENERRRLAADLHDAALQDQLIWYRKLESIMLDHPVTDQLREQLEQIKEGLLDVIHQIRQTCNELRPPLLKEMGLIEALEQLFAEERIRSNYSITLQTNITVLDLNDSQILAVYRIVQELLRNAGKHACASNIQIELEQKDEEIDFYYKDDGRGLELSQLQDSFRHMGISGIKERVRSLDGEIRFDSEPGRGFEVRLRFPLQPASKQEEGGEAIDHHLAG